MSSSEENGKVLEINEENTKVQLRKGQKKFKNLQKPLTTFHIQENFFFQMETNTKVTS